MVLAAFAGERHGAAGVQGRTVGAAGVGGCDGVGVRKKKQTVSEYKSNKSVYEGMDGVG